MENNDSKLTWGRKFLALHENAYKSVSTQYEKLTEFVDAPALEFNIEYILRHQGLKEWTGDTEAEVQTGIPYMIRLKRFYKAIQMSDDDLILNNTKKYEDDAKKIGEERARFRDKRTFEVVSQSMTLNTYTGSPLVSVAHGNLVTPLSTVEATFNKAVETLLEMTDSTGQPANGTTDQNTKLILLTGNRNRANVRGLLKRELVGGGNTNENYGEAMPMSTYWIRDNKWFLIMADSGSKPFAWAECKALTEVVKHIADPARRRQLWRTFMAAQCVPTRYTGIVGGTALTT